MSVLRDLPTQTVDIIVVLRDRFSMYPRSLEALESRTPQPFRILVVAGAPDPETREYLQRLEETRPHIEAILVDHLLTQAEARNLGWRRATARFVVVLENDTIVHENWLPPLLECLQEESAAVVTPLLWWYRGLHAAGGTFHQRQRDGVRVIDYAIDYSGIRRRQVDYPENHCLLFDRQMLPGFEFDDVEPFDVDLGLTLRQRGLRAWLEPRAVATYSAPPTIEVRDLPAFTMRWDWPRWELENGRFAEKWGVTYDRAYKRASYRLQWCKLGLARWLPNALTVGIANVMFATTNRIQTWSERLRLRRSGASGQYESNAAT